MLREGFMAEVNKHGDGKTAIVVNLGRTYVDVGEVSYDRRRGCIVLVPDKEDLDGALWELRKGLGGTSSPGA